MPRLFKKGEHHGVEFKKGMIPWNKGKKGWNKGTKAGFQNGHKFFMIKGTPKYELWLSHLYFQKDMKGIRGSGMLGLKHSMGRKKLEMG